jgi:Protein of unknown function (DUF3822)
MNNNSILLIDPNFDPAVSEQLNLILKIGIANFSYAIVDHEKKQVLAVYDEQECENGYNKLYERLKNDSYLKRSYGDIKVAVHTENLIFIPNELYSETMLDSHTKYFPDVDSRNIYVQPDDNTGFTSIFSLPKSVEELIDQHWPKNEKLQQNIGLLHLAQQYTENTLLIDFTVKSFEVAYGKGQQIIFQQSYQFDHIEEFNYYLLLIINQLGIEPVATTIKIMGIVHEHDEKWNCLAKYFTKIDFLIIESPLDVAILDDMPAHYYTSLLSLCQCG